MRKDENEISGRTRSSGLYALPARHSFSPLMHTTAFQTTGVDDVYLSFDVQPERLEQSIQAIRDLEMLVINLSMPHKMEATKYVDELSQAAHLIGAINTIVNQNGKLVGHITDGIGCMESLKKNGIEIIGKRMTILGAGGAATAIITQAAIDGVKAIDLFNRKDAFYEKIEPKLAMIAKETHCQIHLHDLADEKQLSSSLAVSHLLVNATTIGMAPETEQSPLPKASLLRHDLPVFDVIYHPSETKLLKDAKEAGAKAINGLDMLLYQGAAAFILWTGKEMPVEKIQPLLEETIKK